MNTTRAPRTLVEDLPEVETLSAEEMARIFGAGLARLGLESLENRELMAANALSTLSGGVLHIAGTPGVDNIRIVQNAGGLTVDYQTNLHQTRTGLEISSGQLQQAVNRFRQRFGLRAAEQTNRWLASRSLSLPDLETTLESDLLIARLEERLTAPGVADYFATHQDDFARARLRLLVVASEGEARELLSQMNTVSIKEYDVWQHYDMPPSPNGRGEASGNRWQGDRRIRAAVANSPQSGTGRAARSWAVPSEES